MTMFVRNPSAAAGMAVNLLIPMVMYLLIAHGVQSFRALSTVCATLLVFCLFLSFIGVEQGLAPTGCIVTRAGSDRGGEFDGRPCVNHHECERDGEPGADYLCEHVGLLGTTSIGWRVRYLGRLQDPNELAMIIGVGLPWAFALFERKRTFFRTLLMLLSLTLVAWCIVYTQSRGGQLVFLAVLGAYFVKKQGMKGLIFGAILAAPLLLFGGRSGEEAESSSLERLECWYEGMSMFRAYPIIGVGYGQFVEHHFLTAHNSYVLASAELGFFGLVSWLTVLYISLKIPIVALRRLGPSGAAQPEAEVARVWGMALLTALIGFMVGIFFLSFCYHHILWVYVGLSGAYYSAMRTHDPGYEVEFGWRDFARVLGISVAVVSVLYAYTRLKVG
jgi:hypothetical protein